MIIAAKSLAPDEKVRVVTWDAAEGCAPAASLETSLADDLELTPQYYAQQELVLKRLRDRLLAGEISPVAVYADLTRMTVKDLAARMRLRRSVVESHMTPRGFARARVEDLEGYARQFDVSVADFFQIAVLQEGVCVTESKTLFGRLLQTLVVARAQAPAAGGAPE